MIPLNEEWSKRIAVGLRKMAEKLAPSSPYGIQSLEIEERLGREPWIDLIVGGKDWKSRHRYTGFITPGEKPY